MWLETQSWPGLTDELNPGAFERSSYFFDRLEMRSDAPFKSLQTPNGRDRDTGIGGELMLFPPDQ